MLPFWQRMWVFQVSQKQAPRNNSKFSVRGLIEGVCLLRRRSFIKTWTNIFWDEYHIFYTPPEGIALYAVDKTAKNRKCVKKILFDVVSKSLLFLHIQITDGFFGRMWFGRHFGIAFFAMFLSMKCRKFFSYTINQLVTSFTRNFLAIIRYVF